MPATSTEQILREIVEEQLGVTPELVTLTAKIEEDLGADSLDSVEMVMSIEHEFGIEIDDEAVEEMRTFGDLVKHVVDKVGG